MFFSGIIMSAILVLTSCEKEEADIDVQNTEVESTGTNVLNNYLKDGIDEDEPAVMTISDTLQYTCGSPIIATVELKDVQTNMVIETTSTDSKGYYVFTGLVSGTYDVIVWVEGVIHTTRRVSL